MDALPYAKRKAASLLERGAVPPLPFLEGASRLWAKGAARSLAKPLRFPSHVFTVGVGGATLGGSYRTPIAIAIAEHLSRSERVALVGHGYGARTVHARVVGAGDDVADVGDEALVCARALGVRARVIVGPSRQASVDLASALGATAIVFDGLLDASPVSPSWSVLALDATRPWGAGRVPPLGDLRADPHELMRRARATLFIDAGEGEPAFSEPGTGVFRGTLRLTGARPAGAATVRPLSELSKMRLGLSTAIARPERLSAALAVAGLAPCVVVSAPDHGRPTFPKRAAAELDAWLVTEKCAASLARSEASHPAAQPDVFVLQSALALESAFWAACDEAARMSRL